MRRGVLSALGLLFIALAILAQSAPAKIWDDTKPSWQWTLEERLAKRFDPEQMERRATAERERIDRRVGMGLMSREDANKELASNSSGYSLDGRDAPEVFTPTELFNVLLMRGFPPDGRHQDEGRSATDARAVVLGFGADFWPRLGKVSASYLELRRERDRLSLAQAVGVGGPQDRRLATTLSPKALCWAQAQALAGAKAEFGKEAFLRLLYEVIAPSVSMASSGDAEKASRDLRYRDGGCQ